MREFFYVDVYFLINASLDALCLFAVSRILPRPVRWTRLVLSACLGATISVACSFPVTTAPLDAILLFLFIPICSVICFPAHCASDLLRTSLLFVLCLFFLGGAFVALESLCGIAVSSQRFNWICILGAGLILVATIYFFQMAQRRFQKNILTVSLQLNETDFFASALVDSGNFLIHPQSGRPVVLLSRSAANRMLTEDATLTLLCRNAPSVRVCTPAGERHLCGLFIDEFHLCFGQKRKKLPCVFLAVDSQTHRYAGCDLLIPATILPLKNEVES